MITAETYFHHDTDTILAAVRQNAARRGILWPADVPVDYSMSPLAPRVNHGHWIVDCPWCGSAEFLNDSSLFICQNCWNAAIGHQWLRVEVPENRAEIEAILGKRPNSVNRNWSSSETLAHLRAENKERRL